MSIEQFIKQRGIEEVLHFTTNGGLLGSLHSGFLKSRYRLGDDENLKYIYKPNASYRKDVPWLDYVSLSITKINHEFFAHTCRWHREEDLWWCVLSFDPSILTHEGVYFVTTNNIYPAALRGEGQDGLEALFKDKVLGKYGRAKMRSAEMLLSMPTCQQAEVLYPGELSISYLRRIYVSRGEDQDDVRGQLTALGKSIDVLVEPMVLGVNV